MPAPSSHDDTRCTFAQRDGVLVVDVRSAITDRHVATISDLTEQLAGRTHRPIGVLVRVAAGVAFPTAEARAAFVTYLRSRRSQVEEIHVALEGRGFWAATMTALVFSVSRAAQFGPCIRVHEDLPHAVAGLFARLEATAMSFDSSSIAEFFDRVG